MSHAWFVQQQMLSLFLELYQRQDLKTEHQSSNKLFFSDPGIFALRKFEDHCETACCCLRQSRPHRSLGHRRRNNFGREDSVARAFLPDGEWFLFLPLNN